MTATILARSARAASGLSQTELALRSGVAGSSLSLIEHGKREPTVATLEALVHSTGRTLVTIPTLRADAASIAAQISAVLQSGSIVPSTTLAGRPLVNSHEDWAFRCFIQLADNLAGEIGATRVGLSLTEPAPVRGGPESVLKSALRNAQADTQAGSPWNTAIAALCEYRLNADALPVPEWIRAITGNPDANWEPWTSDFESPIDREQVPVEFLRRGILIEAATLESI